MQILWLNSTNFSRTLRESTVNCRERLSTMLLSYPLPSCTCGCECPLEPIPALIGWRQGYTLDKSPVGFLYNFLLYINTLSSSSVFLRPKIHASFYLPSVSLSDFTAWLLFYFLYLFLKIYLLSFICIPNAKSPTPKLYNHLVYMFVFWYVRFSFFRCLKK